MATIPGGCARLVWQLPDAPMSGWDAIGFPLTVHTAPDAHGWLLAQQFAFLGGAIGYCGIRPQPGGQQEAVFHVTGATADLGARHVARVEPGVDDVCCSTVLPLVYGREYRFDVARRDGCRRIWEGSLLDTATGLRHPLGAWRLDDDGGLDNSHTGFVEYTRALNSCAELPLAEVTFAAPTGPHGTAGQCLRPASYGPCQGKFDYHATAEPDGSVRMRLGRARRDPGPPPRPAPRITVNVAVRCGQPRQPGS